MKNRFVFLLVFLSGYVSFAQRTVEDILADFLDPDSKTVLVAAHRAAHLDYPENSLPAIRQAIELGVDIIELDVKVTKDGIPLLMHDGTIDRTTTGSGKPSDYTYEELKNFRLIHQKDTTDQLIPTFEEALEIVKGHALIDIDIKTGQLDPIVKVIKKMECEDHVFWFDNDYEALEYVRSADPDFMLMPRAYSYEMADSAIHRFRPEVIHIDFSFYDKKVVDLIRQNKARIWINALGIPDLAIANNREDEAIDKLLAFGANIIQTDQPELLLETLKKRNLHP
jgi:glycerophosphoryl diester phosphodiesterase